MHRGKNDYREYMLYMTGYFSIQVEASCVVVAHRSWLTRQKSIPMHVILHIFLLTYTMNKLVEEYKCSNETWIVSCAHGNAPNLGRVDFLIFTQWHWWCSFGNVTLHFLRNWSVGFQTVVSVRTYRRTYNYCRISHFQFELHPCFAANQRLPSIPSTWHLTTRI